ncbi:MAG: hypothetical protein WD048_09695 [Chitinophagales bacterium]
MEFSETIKEKWNSFTKPEKSAIAVLLALVGGVLLFVFGIQIGKVLYSVIEG